MLDKTKILILCKVVDNFGDIGVVYRLARALSDLRPSLELTLVVSNLETFHALAPKIEPKKQIQDFRYKNSVWKVVTWNLEMEKMASNKEQVTGIEGENAPQLPYSLFPIPHSLSLILECFQCGRPDWLEAILFSDDFTDEVQILQIDYLTAESYAEEFHLLKSGTRKANIKKRFFMPGFTKKTGGLVINGKIKTENGKLGATASPSGVSRALSLSRSFHFSNAHSSVRFAHSRTSGFHTLGQENDIKGKREKVISDKENNVSQTPYSLFPIPYSFSLFFFAYDDDCSAVVQAISDFQEKMREPDEQFSVCVFVASGKSSVPFESAWKKCNSPFKIEKIPFLPQEEFDEFILKMNFLFVRGEDSLSRACLSGIPFVWQAYKQDENYQLVKVNALLERMKDFFEDETFEPIQKFWQNYNDYENPTVSEPLTQMLLDSINQKNLLGFQQFAEKLHQNGNLAAHLLEYIDSL